MRKQTFLILAGKKMAKTRPPGNSGFSLLESLFAVSLLTIVFVGSLSTFINCNILLLQTKEQSVANQAVLEKIELVRNMSFNDILALGSSFTSTGFSNLNNPVGTLTVDNPSGSNDLRRVTTPFFFVP